MTKIIKWLVERGYLDYMVSRNEDTKATLSLGVTEDTKATLSLGVSLVQGLSALLS